MICSKCSKQSSGEAGVCSVCGETVLTSTTPASITQSKYSPNYSMPKTTTKSYNPFKMWGSYVIFAIVGLIIIPPILSDSCGGIIVSAFKTCSFNQIILGAPNRGLLFGITRLLSTPINIPLLFFEMNGVSSQPAALLAIVTYTVVGFLAGWGIHSLCRKFKSRK